MSKIQFISLMTPGVTSLFAPSNEAPLVYYSIDAIQKIKHIVETQQKEVAWFGIVDELQDNAYLISDIFIPEQTVTATSVDIKPNAVANLTLKIMDQGYDPSQLRYHGHSHVNMGVHPSTTDQEHLVDYLEHSDWFIREIRNKKGDSKVDVFDKRHGCVFQCVSTDIYELGKDQSFYDKIDDELTAAITVSQFVSRSTATYYEKLGNYLPKKESAEPLNYVDYLRHRAEKSSVEYDDLLTDPFFIGGI